MPGPTKGTARAWLLNEIVLQSGINVLEDMCADVRRIDQLVEPNIFPALSLDVLQFSRKAFPVAVLQIQVVAIAVQRTPQGFAPVHSVQSC